jgi:hypothetical protein
MSTGGEPSGSADAAGGRTQGNKHLCFVDEAWTHTFGLSEENALDYFAMSMFYDYTSNNQAIRTQGASVSQLLNMTGIEYELETVQGDPPMFIVKKQERKSPRVASVLEVYYIIRGFIYQSPSLMDFASTRLMKTALYLDSAVSLMAEEHVYNNTGGHVTFKSSTETEAAGQDKDKEDKTAPKPELVSRELPSMQSTLDDIAGFCESASSN